MRITDFVANLTGSAVREAQEKFENAYHDLMATANKIEKAEANARATKALGKIGKMMRNGEHVNGAAVHE